MATKSTKTESKFNNIILIPTDFSETCNNAISHGVRLALYLNYKVCVLHVINKETHAVLKKKKVGVDYVEKRLKEYKNYYEKKYDVKMDTMAVEGSIFTTINKAAADLKANLMILGTHGKKGLQHVFGSYALRVVLESSVPVIVVQKRSFRDGYNDIIFPISNDLEARQKVTWAKQMATLFNTRNHLFIAKEKDSGLKSRLEIITRQITSVFDKDDIKYTIRYAERSGDFARQVISYAVTIPSGLIMMMTMPQADLPEFSVSAWDERLMFNEAQIPVMCINPLRLGNFIYEWTTWW